MDDGDRRAKIERYLEYGGIDQDISHEIYHDDAVLEFPQSGERFEGVENFREWRRRYPADVEFELRELRGATCGSPRSRSDTTVVRLCSVSPSWSFVRARSSARRSIPRSLGKLPNGARHGERRPRARRGRRSSAQNRRSGRPLGHT
jgi:hypothetical protein